MKPRSQIFSTLALAAALCGAAYAADPGATVPGGSAPHHAWGHGHFGQPSAAKLGLTGDLATQWDAINAQEKAAHQQAFGSSSSVLSDAINSLSSPSADLAALAQQKDAREDARRTQERSFRDQRLALYKNMNATQQAAVRSIMLKHLTNMQTQMTNMQEHAAARAAQKAAAQTAQQ